MKDFFKYITASDEDREWGLFLSAAGKKEILPFSDYPPTDHPTGYYFTWENGRELSEYQINYITKGEGILEIGGERYFVKTGNLMIIRPGVWHRYKPNRATGWTENYIGINGFLVTHFLNKNIFQDQTLIKSNIDEGLIDTYYKIFNHILEEKPGYQQIGSGLVLKLIGQIVASQKQRHFSGKKIERLIQLSRFEMRQHIEKKIDLVQLSESHHINYAYYRKMFKKYVGISPYQYYLELKMMRAKELILSTDDSIKEISYKMGFQSIHYFSRLFKNKFGISPRELRK